MLRALRQPHPGHALFAVVVTGTATMIGGLPFQQLLLTMVCRDLDQAAPNSAQFSTAVDYNSCAKRSDVQSAMAIWTMWLHLAQEIPGFFSMAVSGYLIDVYGRRRGMALAACSLILSSVAYLICSLMRVPVYALFAVNLAQGLLGGLGIMSLSAAAYIADTTDSINRTKYFMFQDGAFAVALCFGPYIGGFITAEFGFTAVFSIMLASAALLLCHLIFIFPEADIIASQSALVSAKKPLKTVFLESIASSIVTLQSVPNYSSALALIGITTIAGFTLSGAQIMFLMYPAKRFGWDSMDIGEFMLFNSSQRIIWLTLLLPYILRTLVARGNDKVKVEIYTLRIGISMSILSELWYGLSSNERTFAFGTVFGGISALASPTTRSLLSTLVPSNHQGRLFGAIKLFESSALMFSTVLINNLYSYTVETFPQAIFFVMASVMAVALGLSFAFVSKQGVGYMQLAMVDESSRAEQGDVIIQAVTEETPLLP